MCMCMIFVTHIHVHVAWIHLYMYTTWTCTCIHIQYVLYYNTIHLHVHVHVHVYPTTTCIRNTVYRQNIECTCMQMIINCTHLVRPLCQPTCFLYLGKHYVNKCCGFVLVYHHSLFLDACVYQVWYEVASCKAQGSTAWPYIIIETCLLPKMAKFSQFLHTTGYDFTNH